jgi:ABC-2 type transport system ATP-binding protein
MVDLAADGRTVLLSSHLIGEVERVADIVAIVRDGQVMMVEPLDALKRSTREVTVTMQGAATAPPDMPGLVLRSERRGRQWQILVRGLADEAQLDQLNNRDGVVAVESRTPSLEEIFVGYMRADRPLPPEPQPQEGATASIL